MIFFIIMGSSNNNTNNINASGMGNNVLIAWCERKGCATLADLQTTVLKAASLDPVCMDIAKEAKRRFGLCIPGLAKAEQGDVDQAFMQKLLDDTFYYWAHPSIGNIGLSPAPRPVHAPLPGKLRPTWSDCTALSTATKKAILAMAATETFQRLDLAARDQVRIVRNETELARAIIGEIACAATKRLEKLLALRLCSSDALYTSLRRMLDRFVASTAFDQLCQSDAHEFEYITYYLHKLQKKLTGDPVYRFFLVRALVATSGPDATQDNARATLRKLPKPTGWTRDQVDAVVADFITIWLPLPPAMRCIMLINDLKKLWFKANIVPIRNPERVTLCWRGDIRTLKSPAPCEVQVAASGFPPKLEDVRFAKASSWSRDESLAATIGYRRLLCPLWGGPSGHVISAFAFWRTMAGDTFDGSAIALALFAFWRLFYDKRISAVHTLVESLEETLTWLVPERKSAKAPDPRPTPCELALWMDGTITGDAYTMALGCLTKSGRSINPFALMSLLENGYRAAARSAIQGGNANTTIGFDAEFAWLLGEINRLRGDLDKAGYFVPQWTWDLSGRKGLAAGSVAPLFNALRAGTTLDDDVLNALVLSYLGPRDPSRKDAGSTPGKPQAATRPSRAARA